MKRETTIRVDAEDVRDEAMANLGIETFVTIEPSGVPFFEGDSLWVPVILTTNDESP